MIDRNDDDPRRRRWEHGRRGAGAALALAAAISRRGSCGLWEAWAVIERSSPTPALAAAASGDRRPALLEERYGPAMDHALVLAEGAARAGEVPVGAVVLDAGGEVLAEAANARETGHDPTAHAEIRALRAAGRALGRSHLDGCSLVVTLEPCTMCAGAIQLARLARVVLAAWEPRTGACGSIRDVLRDPRVNHRVEVIAGLRSEVSAALLRDFFAPRR